MLQTRDPAIKLFGTTISLPGNEEYPAFPGDRSGASVHEESLGHESNFPSTNSKEKIFKEEGERTDEKESLCRTSTETKEKDGALPLISEELADLPTFSENNENPKTPVENETAKAFRTEEKQIETSSQEKTTIKRPDQILPCPRCNSKDTKFCYYNNYNVNQPRHFCKNCQRYWTVGGTMRNMLVGAGSRKNKNSASHYRRINVPEALQTARTDVPDGIHHPTLKPNGTILTFGSDAPFCQSMASVLNTADKTMCNRTQNGFHRSEHRIPVSCGRGEDGMEISKGSSIATSSSTEEGRRVGLQEQMMHNFHGFPQVPCFPAAPWPYPWNSTQWISAVQPPAFCPNFPMSSYPPTIYWGCPVPGPWSVPWLSPPLSSPNHGGPGSSPNSPTLGKHSREGNALKPSISEKEDLPKQSNSERCSWIPKTMTIDDPGEATMSPMWATLGIKKDKSDSIRGGGLLRDFQSKGDEKNRLDKTSQVLQANPAALSRSLNFRENS